MKITGKFGLGLFLGVMVSDPGLTEIRRGEGVFLDASSHINGSKICRFSNGTITRVEIGEDCFASGPPRKNRTAKEIDTARAPSYSAPLQSPANNTAATARYKRGEGVYLNASEHGPSGEKYCHFSNGVTIQVKVAEDCFEEQPLKGVPAEISDTKPSATPERFRTPIPESGLKIKIGGGIFLNSSAIFGREKYCNFSNGITYVVAILDGCFDQEPIRVIPTRELEVNQTPENLPKFARPAKKSPKPSNRSTSSGKTCLNCTTKKVIIPSKRPK